MASSDIIYSNINSCDQEEFTVYDIIHAANKLQFDKIQFFYNENPEKFEPSVSSIVSVLCGCEKEQNKKIIQILDWLNKNTRIQYNSGAIDKVISKSNIELLEWFVKNAPHIGLCTRFGIKNAYENKDRRMLEWLRDHYECINLRLPIAKEIDEITLEHKTIYLALMKDMEQPENVRLIIMGLILKLDENIN